MELSKKTTVLFPPKLYEHLVRVARQRGSSVGELIRSACEAQYGGVPTSERLRAVRELEALSLPVASPAQLVKESVPVADDLLP